MKTILIVGAGIFGVTAAAEMRRRGWTVTLVDPGPLPHPLAASTDISKAVRMEYGADEEYTALVEESLDGWRAWNREFAKPLFHETGTLFLRRTPLTPGTFEYESWKLLTGRGHGVQRLDRAAIAAGFPAWNSMLYSEGIFNPAGGWAESGSVVTSLLRRAGDSGVHIVTGVRFARFLEAGGRVTGIETEQGDRIAAEITLLATGAWTPHLLPEMVGAFRSNGMPVFHLKPADPALFLPERFPMFGADISATGYYGFPLHPSAGVVKIANHGPGREMLPESTDRVVTADEVSALRAFLGETFPALFEAPLVGSRVCLYCDSSDGNLWIALHPDRPGLAVAAGGSGHAFKFAPVLGRLIANAVEGHPDPYLARFGWRPDRFVAAPASGDAARSV